MPVTFSPISAAAPAAFPLISVAAPTAFPLMSVAAPTALSLMPPAAPAALSLMPPAAPAAFPPMSAAASAALSLMPPAAPAAFPPMSAAASAALSLMPPAAFPTALRTDAVPAVLPPDFDPLAFFFGSLFSVSFICSEGEVSAFTSAVSGPETFFPALAARTSLFVVLGFSSGT